MNTEYKCVTTVDGIHDYIGGSGIVAFDFETAPDDPYREEDKAALDYKRHRFVEIRAVLILFGHVDPKIGNVVFLFAPGRLDLLVLSENTYRTIKFHSILFSHN